MLYFKKNLLFIWICLASYISASAQTFTNAFKKLPSDLVRQDFSMLRDSLQDLQPSLYRYQSKATIGHIFDSCFATIRDSMTVPDFYALTSFVVATIGDRHTNCKLPDPVMHDYMGNVKVFPPWLCL